MKRFRKILISSLLLSVMPITAEHEGGGCHPGAFSEESRKARQHPELASGKVFLLQIQHGVARFLADLAFVICVAGGYMIFCGVTGEEVPPTYRWYLIGLGLGLVTKFVISNIIYKVSRRLQE